MKNVVQVVIAGSIAYVAFYVAYELAVGVAAALTVPSGYLEWFREKDTLRLGLWLWDLGTVVPAMAVTAFSAAFLAASYTHGNWKSLSAVMISLYLIHFFSQTVLSMQQNPEMWELNGISLLQPAITPVVFMALGCWLAYVWRSKSTHATSA